VRLRAAALMAVAALGVHELRYLLGYQSGAGHALEQQGHAYLSVAGALASLLLALAAGQLVARVAQAGRAGKTEAAPRSFAFAWAAASVGLTFIYASQELLEGSLSDGHPGGLAGVFGHGGGWALPLAMALGGLVVLALRGARAAVRAAARAATLPCALRAVAASRGRALRTFRPRACVLARNLGGRAPPLTF
jgi:hypothetical protein